MADPVLTILDAETFLKDRCGRFMALVERDPTPSVSTASIHYRDALREGLASLNIVPASFSAITDADLSAVSAAHVPQFLDIAQLRQMMSTADAYLEVTHTVSLGAQQFDQLRQAMAARIAQLAADVKAKYGYGIAKIGAGSIDLGFRSKRWRRYGEFGVGDFGDW